MTSNRICEAAEDASKWGNFGHLDQSHQKSFYLASEHSPFPNVTYLFPRFSFFSTLNGFRMPSSHGCFSIHLELEESPNPVILVPSHLVTIPTQCPPTKNILNNFQTHLLPQICAVLCALQTSSHHTSFSSWPFRFFRTSGNAPF